MQEPHNTENEMQSCFDGAHIRNDTVNRTSKQKQEQET